MPSQVVLTYCPGSKNNKADALSQRHDFTERIYVFRVNGIPKDVVSTIHEDHNSRHKYGKPFAYI